VAEYGLRHVFPRIPDHSILAGLSAENLHNWRGEATILPSRLKYELRARYGPTVQWCDIPVTRIWRCGNRGNVASALIEKPARGDWLPILDGGYSLQYSPLMEYAKATAWSCSAKWTSPDGPRLIQRLKCWCAIFCATSRMETNPAPERTVRWRSCRQEPSPSRRRGGEFI